MTDSWNDEIRSVELTNSEWIDLRTYILMTSQHRKEMIESWKERSAEKNSDGTPRYIYAESNFKSLVELDATLAAIVKKIN